MSRTSSLTGLNTQKPDDTSLQLLTLIFSFDSIILNSELGVLIR